MPPPSTGRRSPQESSDLILEAAQQLLWEVPLGELTVGRLMAATPLGRSSFYVYFDGLDDLVAQLLGQLEQALWQPARAWVDGASDLESLREALGGVVQVWAEHGPVLAAIVQASWQDEHVRSLWRDGLMDRFITGVATGIRRGIESGEMSGDLEPTETATALLMMNERYLMDRLGRLPQQNPATASETVRNVWTNTLYST